MSNIERLRNIETAAKKAAQHLTALHPEVKQGLIETLNQKRETYIREGNKEGIKAAEGAIRAVSKIITHPNINTDDRRMGLALERQRTQQKNETLKTKEAKQPPQENAYQKTVFGALSKVIERNHIIETLLAQEDVELSHLWNNDIEPRYKKIGTTIREIEGMSGGVFLVRKAAKIAKETVIEVVKPKIEKIKEGVRFVVNGITLPIWGPIWVTRSIFTWCKNKYEETIRPLAHKWSEEERKEKFRGIKFGETEIGSTTSTAKPGTFLRTKRQLTPKEKVLKTNEQLIENVKLNMREIMGMRDYFAYGKERAYLDNTASLLNELIPRAGKINEFLEEEGETLDDINDSANAISDVGTSAAVGVVLQKFKEYIASCNEFVKTKTELQRISYALQLLEPNRKALE